VSELSLSRANTDRVEALQGATMGTTWSVKLVAARGLHPAEIRGGIEARLDRVVAQMSTWEPDSDLSRFNRAPAGSWYRLRDECLTVLAYALEVAGDTGGAYDPTVGPLVDLWGFGPAQRQHTRPPADAIAAARARTGWAQLTLDVRGRRMRQPGGVSVDLSSIAKGFAVDQVAAHLRRLGVTSYLVEIGGELRGYGAKPDGTPWWVALERPPDSPHEGSRPGDMIVALHDLSVATSGDYRRFFEDGGRSYSHTIDPRTGCPVDHGLASVTVLHPECMIADALATALTVLGPAAGLAYARRRGLAALFIERGPRGIEERMTPRFAAMLE
jgi:thiamine biosynthesis lipoprotein